MIKILDLATMYFVVHMMPVSLINILHKAFLIMIKAYIKISDSVTYM